MSVKLPCAYQIGTVVYHRLDTDGRALMIVSVTFSADGGRVYEAADAAGTAKRFYEIELTTVRSFGTPAAGGETNFNS